MDDPIENMWSIIKTRLKALHATTKKDLIANFIRVWNRDPEIQNMCKKMVDSMPKRVNAVIASEGWQTKC